MGESYLVIQRRKLISRGAARLAPGAAPVQGRAGWPPSLLPSARGCSLPPMPAFLGKPESRWEENTQLAYSGRQVINIITSKRRGRGKADADSKDVRFREPVFSGPAVSRHFAGSRRLPQVCMRACAFPAVPTGCMLAWQRASVSDLGTQTVSRSLWASPTCFPVLWLTDVSQMFLTSCLAPCSACVCLFWTAH